MPDPSRSSGELAVAKLNEPRPRITPNLDCLPPPGCKVYTPHALAEAMIQAIGDEPNDLWLDPCVGPGAFVSVLHQNGTPKERITAIDIENIEGPWDSAATTIRGVDFFHWCVAARRRFTKIIANPPYVALCKLPSELKQNVQRLNQELDPCFGLRSNYWCAFLAASLRTLQTDGSLAFVLPAAWEYALYAERLRKCVFRSFRSVEVHRSREPLFPNVREGSVVLVAKGFGKSSEAAIRYDHSSAAALINALRNPRIDSDRKAQYMSHETSPGVETTFGGLFTVGIGCVTGDVNYFLLSEEKRLSLDLPTTALVPVLSKARHLATAQVGKREWDQLKQANERVWLFSPDASSVRDKAVRLYIRHGEKTCDLEGYKLTNRKPWYTVPGIRLGIGFISGMKNTGPWLCLRRMRGLAATNTLYVVSSRRAMSVDEQAAWGLSLLSSYTRKQLHARVRRYPDGLTKLEPHDIASLRLLPPKHLPGSMELYRQPLDFYCQGTPLPRRRLRTNLYVIRLYRLRVRSSMGNSVSQAAPVVDPPLLSTDDAALLPLLEIIERAVAHHLRIPVLSLWSHVPSIALLASHLHLKWPGSVPSLPLSPRIGIFPFLGSDFELLSQPLYQASKAQSERQGARARRLNFTTGIRSRGDLYPDWEQALDRRRSRIGSLVLPASSFVSLDRVSAAGDIKTGNRGMVGKFSPRNEFRPHMLVPARGEVTRQMVREFDSLDLVLVNVQNLRGRQMTRAVEFFLSTISPSVPLVILASSPADLVLTGALNPPSIKTMVLSAPIAPSSFEVVVVNQDRPLRERQLCFALEGIDTRSELLERLATQARRTWWATRQSLSYDMPREAVAFETLCADMLLRFPGQELELLSEVRRLIAEESQTVDGRQERLRAVTNAALHDTGSRTVLIIVRSDAAAEELRTALAKDLSVDVLELTLLGIRVVSVFSPWPDEPYDTCIAAGYFGANTIDMLFASRAAKRKLIVDPIEARVAVWDAERRFCSVAELPAGALTSLCTLSELLEPHACPSSDPISLPALFTDTSTSAKASASQHSGRSIHVCVCFADGSTRQALANSRFEVLGRKRLQLQSIAAKDLAAGDQVVLLQDDERAAFSDKLLRLLDQGRFKVGRETRSNWLTIILALRKQTHISATAIKRKLDAMGHSVHVTTVQSWLPSAADDDCGIPDTEAVFLAFARVLGMALPDSVLKEWFVNINRLRVDHRRIGRQLARAIRGAYLGRLDPISVARMEREWGVQAKALLEAARVAVVDDVITFAESNA